jgi:hypothetical protein
MAKRIFLLDSSGSMEAVLEDTIGGFNSFVRSQVSLGGTLTLYTFSNTCTCVYRDTPIEEVEPLTCEKYVPGGSTALYDALGRVLTENEPLDGALLVVLTDGQENSSRKYTKTHVKDLIRLSPGLDVMYVGVDLDEATELGIENTLEYRPDRTPELFRHVSESVAVSAERQTRPRLSRMVGSIGAIDSNTQLNTCQTDPTSHPSQNDDEDTSSSSHDPYV